MKRKLVLAGLSLLFFIYGKAQHYDYLSPVSTSLGLSGASDTTIWSLFANPSGIASVSSVVSGGGYHNSFFAEALSSQAAFVLIPTSCLNVGFAYMRFGNNLFNVQNLSMTVARSLSPKFYMGCRFEYLFRYIQGADHRATFVADVGFHFRASDNIMLAVMSENPGKQAFLDEYNDQPLPSSLAVACCAELSPFFFITADMVHRADLSKQIYAFGISSRMHEMFDIRAAISAKPVRLSMGATLKWHELELDVAVNHHDPLGISSTVGIACFFGQGRGGGF